MGNIDQYLRQKAVFNNRVVVCKPFDGHTEYQEWCDDKAKISYKDKKKWTKISQLWFEQRKKKKNSKFKEMKGQNHKLHKQN